MIDGRQGTVWVPNNQRTTAAELIPAGPIILVRRKGLPASETVATSFRFSIVSEFFTAFHQGLRFQHLLGIFSLPLMRIEIGLVHRVLVSSTLVFYIKRASISFRKMHTCTQMFRCPYRHFSKGSCSRKSSGHTNLKVVSITNVGRFATGAPGTVLRDLIVDSYPDAKPVHDSELCRNIDDETTAFQWRLMCPASTNSKDETYIMHICCGVSEACHVFPSKPDSHC